MKRITIFFLGLLYAICSYGQGLSPDIIGAAGDHFSNGTVSLEGTVGETVTFTQSGAQGILSQGFHQSAYLITALDPPKTRVEIDLTPFPNPTTDQITLRIRREGLESLTASIVDLQGRTLTQQSTVLSQTDLRFSLDAYSGGVYLLQVTIPSLSFVQNFKIQRI